MIISFPWRKYKSGFNGGGKQLKVFFILYTRSVYFLSFLKDRDGTFMLAQNFKKQKLKN